MEVLAIIQARGGSKSIPGKNIRLLAGKPLIVWTIKAAKQAKSVNRVIVSTDDPAIAEVARAAGAEVPFLRPAEFAIDSAKSVGLLKHALEWLAEHEKYRPDIVVQLKPTNPLRTAGHIDDAVNAFMEVPGYDSLITVTASSAHPLKTWKFEGDEVKPFISADQLFGIKEAYKMPRQALPAAYVQNSCVNVVVPATILEKGSSVGTRIRGLAMEREDAVNIDTLLDFDIAELLMSRRLKGQAT